MRVSSNELFCTLKNSNILDVTKPQTNNESVCVRVKCSVTLSTCLSNELALQQNVRQDRKFQAQRDVASCSACARCIDAWSCGQSSVYATKYATRTVIM